MSSPHLTVREREVLGLLANGKSSKEVAFELHISVRTACCHRSHVLSKLDAHNTPEAIRNAIYQNIIPLASFTPERHQVEAGKSGGCAP